MPLLVIAQQFGSRVTHSVIMCDDPRPGAQLGKSVARIAISAEAASLPLDTLARLFPAVIEGDEVFGPDAATVRRGLRKAERHARRQRESAPALCGPPEGSTGQPEA